MISLITCFLIEIQAFDLIEMLKKEEEILSAVKEKQLQVLISLLFRKLSLVCYFKTSDEAWVKLDMFMSSLLTLVLVAFLSFNICQGYC